MDHQTPNTQNQAPKRSWAMTRARLKTAAKLRYGLNLKSCILVALIGSVATSLFSMIINLRLPDFETMLAAEDLNAYIPQLLKGNALSLLFGFIMAPLTIGSYGFFTKLIRGEKPAVSSIFTWLGEGKKLATAYLGQLMYLLYLILWSLLLIGIPGALYVGASYMVSLRPAGVELVLYILASLLYIIMLVVGAAKLMTWQPALYMLGADPEMGVKRAFALCRYHMHGHMWEYFLFQLSFLGWQLLASFTCGLGMFFVQPYMNLANAAFVEFVRGNEVVQPQPPQMPRPPFENQDDDSDHREDQ
ncbi:MAG: DUF975 family protein [Clostridia bacterium]|nr:DUF975 family protein [Clostridia bacterium]